jgi:hypothetical protein
MSSAEPHGNYGQRVLRRRLMQETRPNAEGIPGSSGAGLFEKNPGLAGGVYVVHHDHCD